MSDILATARRALELDKEVWITKDPALLREACAALPELARFTIKAHERLKEIDEGAIKRISELEEKLAIAVEALKFYSTSFGFVNVSMASDALTKIGEK